MNTFIVTGVPIYLVHGRPPVEALGVRDCRVACAGSIADVEASLPPDASLFTPATGAIMPAFVDAHQHAFLVAVDPFTDVLHRKARTIPDLLGVLRTLIPRHNAHDDGHAWLRFHGYAPMEFAEHRSPTAMELDAVCTDTPLHVLSRTFHESAVNSAGLAALGIGRHTPDPPGGRIMRNRRGQPTGVLLEASSFAAERTSRPRESDGLWRDRLAVHGQNLLANGIATIGDAAVPMHLSSTVVEVLAAVGVAAHPLLVSERIDEPGFVAGATAKVLADGGEYCHLCMTRQQVARVMRASMRASLGPDGVTARAVGRRSGMPRRESDHLWHSGVRYPTGDAFGRVLTQACEAGSSVAVHAVGNGAVDAVLAALKVDRTLADQVALRVEYAMVVDADLINRLGVAGLPVVSQPGFLSAYGHELALVPVPSPLQLMPFRAMQDAGVPLVFSSDYPASDLSPWRTVASAVQRTDRFGTVIGPDQVLSVAEALVAHTVAGAEVLGEATAGRLIVGGPATMIWSDTDPYTARPEDFGTITTTATWVAGELRFGTQPSRTSR